MNHEYDRPTLVLNPPDDDVFASAAESLVQGGVRDVHRMQELLRMRFPLAVVRPRALAGERAPVWYVYRDGHWIRAGTERPQSMKGAPT